MVENNLMKPNVLYICYVLIYLNQKKCVSSFKFDLYGGQIDGSLRSKIKPIMAFKKMWRQDCILSLAFVSEATLGFKYCPIWPLLD